MSVAVFVYIVNTGHILAKIQNVKMTFVDFDSLPSNGIIAKIILCDVDLLFECPKFELLVSLK